MQSQPTECDPASTAMPADGLAADEALAEPTGSPATPPLPPAGEQRRIDLHRRRAIVGADRIDIRPSRTAIIPPLCGFLFGLGAVALIVLGVTSSSIPYFVLAILLLIALLAVPLSGITLVYALFGANVIFDRAKHSAAWQQGFLGMGIGTTELVPFWKIAFIAVTEAGSRPAAESDQADEVSGASLPEGASGGRTEEFAQWEAVLVKTSGSRLPIAGMTVPRQFVRGGFGPVHELAAAIAALTGSSVSVELAPIPAPPKIASEPEPAEPPMPTMMARTPRRRRRRS